MATKQGMCKNCGSLVMFDDRDELCECVFCNCVFPSTEAAELLDNHEGYEFKNEKFEKQEGAGVKHYYSNPVMPDVIEKAVKRDIVSKKQSDTAKLKPNEFEISPNDVKAPKKLIIGMAVGATLLVVIIVAIALPLFFSRKALTESITADIARVYDSVEIEDSYTSQQFIVYGLSCQYVKLGLASSITEDDARTIYDNYRSLRSEKRGDDSGTVEMYIYTPDTVYFVVNGVVDSHYQESVEIVETTEESK